MEVIRIKRKSLALLLPIVVVMIIGSVAVAAYASDNGASKNGRQAPYAFEGMGGRGRGHMGRMMGGGRSRGGFGFIEVSEEYEAEVLAIVESDPDVPDGYTVLGVRPIIRTRVGSGGSVENKAANAIVMLENEDDTTSKAILLVDLEAGEVTKIVVFTRTVIKDTTETTVTETATSA